MMKKTEGEEEGIGVSFLTDNDNRTTTTTTHSSNKNDTEGETQRLGKNENDLQDVIDDKCLTSSNNESGRRNLGTNEAMSPPENDPFTFESNDDDEKWELDSSTGGVVDFPSSSKGLFDDEDEEEEAEEEEEEEEEEGKEDGEREGRESVTAPQERVHIPFSPSELQDILLNNDDDFDVVSSGLHVSGGDGNNSSSQLFGSDQQQTLEDDIKTSIRWNRTMSSASTKTTKSSTVGTSSNDGGGAGDVHVEGDSESRIRNEDIGTSMNIMPFLRSSMDTPHIVTGRSSIIAAREAGTMYIHVHVYDQGLN